MLGHVAGTDASALVAFAAFVGVPLLAMLVAFMRPTTRVRRASHRTMSRVAFSLAMGVAAFSFVWVVAALWALYALN